MFTKLVPIAIGIESGEWNEANQVCHGGLDVVAKVEVDLAKESC